MTSQSITRPALLSACAYMLQAAGISVAELAQHMGQQQATPTPKPAGIDLIAGNATEAAEQPPQQGRAPTHNDRRVIDAADCPKGITVTGVMTLLTLQEAQAHRICSRLAESHHLTRVKKPGIRAVHFFARPADALAWFQSQEQPEDAAPAEAAPALPPAPFPGPAPAAAPSAATLTAAEVRSVEIHQAKVAGSKKAPAPMGARTPHKPVPTAKQNVTIVPPKPPEAEKPKGEAIKTEKTVEIRDTTKRANNRLEAAPPLPPDPRYPSFSSMPPGMDPRTGQAWGARA